MDNRFLVGVAGGERIAILAPPVGRTISRDDALNLAAWLVVLAELTDAELADAIEEIEGT